MLPGWDVPAATALAVLSPHGRASPSRATTVSGTLTNSLTSEPVADATVTIEERGSQARSGSDGTVHDSRTSRPASITCSSVPTSSCRIGRRFAVAASLTLPPSSIDPELHFSEVRLGEPRRRETSSSRFKPTDVLGGTGADKELQPTLGATLENQPGIALRSFGPGPARPVIRGLDGDRVLILRGRPAHGRSVEPVGRSRRQRESRARRPASRSCAARRRCCTAPTRSAGWSTSSPNDIPDGAGDGAHGQFTFDAGIGGWRSRRRRRRHGRQRAASRCT